MARKRKRKPALTDWNFWTIITATVYQVNGYHPDDLVRGVQRPRVIDAYYGKTMQTPWTRRIEAHLWGARGEPPKSWADTVPGYRPDGPAGRAVDEVVAAGGARVVWTARSVPLILTWVEFVVIRWGRPYYNDRDNRDNPRRITKDEQIRQRAVRDGRRRGARVTAPVSIGLRTLAGVLVLAAGLALLVLAVMVAP